MNMHPTNTGGKVLLACEIRFWQRNTGAAQRIAALCDAITSAGFDLILYFPDRIASDERHIIENAWPTLRIETPPLLAIIRRAVRRRLGAALGKSGLGPTSLPEALRRPWIDERLLTFHRVCDRYAPQVVLVEYLIAGYLLEGIEHTGAASALKVIDTIDVLSSRAQRYRAEGQEPPLDISPQEESAALNRFDVLLAIQEVEAVTLRALCPGCNVLCVGYGQPVEPLPPRTHGGPPRALFFGSAAHHNVLAVEYLYKAVWPEVRQAVPDAELLVAGSAGDALSGKEVPGLRLLGRVAQPIDAYRQAEVVLNPATVGSGLKIKNVEALCHGLPLVTTPLGAEGMAEGAGLAFLVGDSPEALARHTAHLLANADARAALSAQALEYARTHLSPTATTAPLLELLRTACYGQAEHTEAPAIGHQT